MRNIRISVFAALFTSIMIFSAWANAQESAGANCPAYVLDQQGEAQYKESDGAEWSALAVNTCVYPGDIIRTLEGGSVSLQMGDKSVLRINEKSDFQLWNEDPDSDLPNEVDVEAGEMLTTMNPDEGEEIPMKVNTPSGVVAVKGTEFYVLVDEEGKTDVKVMDGVVEIFNDFGSVMAEAGMATSLIFGDMPVTPFGFDVAQFGEALGWASALSTGDIKGFIKGKIKEAIINKVAPGLGGMF